MTIGEIQSCRSEGINIWSLDLLGAIHADIVEADIVVVDDDDVWFLGGGEGGNHAKKGGSDSMDEVFRFHV